jgi:copper chaperone CopZ
MKNIVGIIIVVSMVIGCSISEKAGHKMDDHHSENHNHMANAEMEWVQVADASEHSTHTMVKIPTAQCGMCDMTMSSALEKLNGIEKFAVSIDDLVIHIDYDKSKVSIQDIEKTISNVGYQANDLPADKTAYSKLHGCCKLPKDRG